jgi:thioredoxin 1
MLKQVDINDSQFDTLVLKSALPVLLECASPECIICKTMAERIREAGKDYQQKMVFLRLDVNENKRWQDFNVRVIPTILYFKGGVLVFRQEHFPETQEIREQVRRLAGKEGATLDISKQFKTALDLESAATQFYKHVSANIKHGKTKERFRLIYEESLAHRDLLEGKFRELTGEAYAPDASARVEGVDAKPQSFSMLGALKMAIKIEEKLLSFYKGVQKDKLVSEKDFFKKFVKEEASHLKQLQKETKFVQDKELFSSMEMPGYPSWLTKAFE